MTQGGARKTIRQLREARGWAQIDLAGRLGVDRSTISRWENGLRLPPAPTHQRLAQLFGVGVEAIALPSEAAMSGAAMSNSTRLLRKTLRQLRAEQNWSQDDVAVRLGISQSAIASWELGRRVPRPARRQRLADLFGVGVGEIAFGPSEPP